jgi:hypothetical protein
LWQVPLNCLLHEGAELVWFDGVKLDQDLAKTF